MLNKKLSDKSGWVDGWMDGKMTKECEMDSTE
jgi:hypothetical protein